MQLAGLNVYAWQQRSAIESRRQAMAELLRATHPGVRTVLDAPLQMQRENERLRVAAGRAGDGSADGGARFSPTDPDSGPASRSEASGSSWESAPDDGRPGAEGVGPDALLHCRLLSERYMVERDPVASDRAPSRTT